VKVALVHDWLTGMRGGERCLEQFCRMFPDADIFTLFHFEGSVSPTIEEHSIRTSFLQRFPFAKKHYRNYLPLFPMAIESFKLEDYDLIVSSSHCVAKGVLFNPEAVHITYCFTPMRYIWDRRYDYFGNSGKVRGTFIPFVLHYLRMWDVTSASRVSHFIAISEYVRRRIRAFYCRDATVIYPPVDCDRFQPSDSVEDYYLLVSAFAPYKKLDQAVLAFNKLGRRLLVVGSGQEEKKLKSISRENIEFMGWVSEEKLADLYAKCRALIFPGVEDFGLVPVEVQAAGRPVIAYGKGGVLESVIPFKDRNAPGTGMFFRKQTPLAIIEAVEAFERVEGYFSSEVIRENAMRFDAKEFVETFKRFIDGIVGQG